MILKLLPTPPCAPMTSAPRPRRNRSVASVCSFQSESSCTRPICCSTRETRSRYWVGFSEKSPYMIALLVGVDDSGVHSGGGGVLEARAQVGHALREEEVVERAHLGLVVRALCDLLRAVERELRVVGLAEAHAREFRLHAPHLGFDEFGRLALGFFEDEVRLAVIALRRARLPRHPAEADAAEL